MTICLGPWALKLARNSTGRRCNRFEAGLWARATPVRRNMLCPVLARLPFGLAVCMPRVESLSEEEAQHLIRTDGFPDWDYVPPDDECPFEYKASDWGRLSDGRLVALDYSAPALCSPATDLEEASDRQLKPEVVPITGGTGTWPHVRPRPWKLTPDRPGEAVLIDPVAVASETSFELKAMGWPGISLMDQSFQMSLLNAPPGTATNLVEGWFADHQDAVCNHLATRLESYDVDGLSKTAKTAMAEALAAYREGRYLSVVRVLFPEFECFARALVDDKTKKKRQSEVIQDLKNLLGETPVIQDDALESFSLFHFIEDHLFRNCFTEADAEKFGSIPNRHAETHGFASYGNRQGATTLVCVMDYLLRMMDRLKKLGAFSA